VPGIITRHSLKDQAAAERARVLLAEDNPVNQKVMVRTLEKLGYRVDVAKDGREAVKAVQGGDYDLVLMDCEMPELDGYEATRVIRDAEVDEQHIPIVALTANVMDGNREKCLQCGMDDHVIKPVKRQVLAEVLTRWLRPESGMSSSTSPRERGGD
jgi:CheY-like chemotaxis protein